MDFTIAKRRPWALAVLALLCCALAVPATALASSGGGSGLPGSGSSGSGSSGSGSPSSGSPSGTGVSAQFANGTVSAIGNGITVQAHESTMLSRGLTFSGTALGDVGDTIEIERSGHETNWQWAPTVTTTVNPDGTFSAVWQTDHIGRFAIRAVLASSTMAQAALSVPSMTVTVYLPAIATLYGPSLWGKRTACGERLTRTTIGVANRTLRCGTKVALYWGGRTLVVPVIDRGPYANHANWDLTMATARALGMDGTETIGAVSLPQP